MAAIKSAASRYNSFDSRSSTQSHQSDPSTSAELKPSQSSLKRLVSGPASRRNQSPASLEQNTSRALVKAKSSDVAPTKAKNEQNLSAMVKKLMERRAARPKKAAANLVMPTDFIAEDLKKTVRKGSNFAGLHRKLFSSKGSGSGSAGSEKKALTEVKPNTRTLAMVLRSERELLSQNKEQETEITELKLMLEEKNREVEKLKDLCLKQREEIKALKSAILFPDVTNSQLQELVKKQGSELKQAKQLIPCLQRQVTSLTGQLHCLAEDLAEVKADKYSVRGCYNACVGSPKTLAYDQEDAANSLFMQEFSSGDQTTPGSPDDMFLKDLNPCLTPYYANTKSKEFEAMGYDSPQDERFSGNDVNFRQEIDFDSRVRKISKSSDCRQCSNSGIPSARVERRSDESKRAYGRHV